MQVSVIIPCYKDSATLARALDSVVSQTRSVDEIILVNDASPESTEIENVLVAYPQVRYIVNPRNLGLAATRNAGVLAATGEVISFLDADDELHPQKIEFQLSKYKSNRAISCNVQRIGDDRGTDRVTTYTSITSCSIINKPSSLVRKNSITGASLMIAKDLFLSIGGYDEKLRSCEDFDFWLRVLSMNISVHNINLPLYLYRLNENGLSRNLVNISYWELEVVKKYYKNIQMNENSVAGEPFTLALWLIRHLMRYEATKNEKLLSATIENFNLLNKWPLIKSTVNFLFAKRILAFVNRCYR